MQAPRYLRCIGYPVLYAPTGEPTRFRTKKHLALLVYLAVEGRQAHRRDRLAELFWPHVMTAEARHSLATALSILRPRVGSGAIEATRDHVIFAPGSIVVDVVRLFASELTSPEPPDDLEIAGFLEGFDLPDCKEFALWKDRVQARLLPQQNRVFTHLVDLSRRSGNTRHIEDLANRMLALDELCEEAVRAKMEVLALAGDRLAALRLYEEWRHKVAEELSASPSESLAAMAAQLRKRGWERVPVADIPGPTLDQRRGHTFVGRTTEHRVLYDAWKAIQNRARAHVMVLGDSGVGKTTLVDRFTAVASLEGATVTRVQCYDLEREIPYSTIAGLVLGVLDRPEVLGTPPEALAELSRIVPQLRQRFSAIPLPKDTHGETARIELTEALHQLLDALTESAPVILVIDDLHLADDASLAVLHLLLRRAMDQRTMLTMIARPGELALGSQGRLFRDLAGELGIRELEVQPFTEDESAELLSELMSASPIKPPKHVRKALLEAAGGYPMVLELLVQDWQANGDNALGLAVDAMTVDLRAGRGHLAAYQKAIARIARSVDPATRAVLYLASILGPRLNDLAMYNLANLTLGQTMAGLAQLTEARVFRDSNRGLEFINELARAHIYASIPSTVRKALHGAIADRLLVEDSAAVQSHGLEIAWHCLRAGRQDEALPHLLSGARQAMRQGAPHVAERALESALPTLSSAGSPKVLLLMVEAMQEQGRWQDSLDVLANIPNAESRDLHWWAVVLRAGARRHLSASVLEETRAEIPLLITILQESCDGRTRVSAARALAYFASTDLDAAAARKLLPLVNQIPAEGLDDDTQGQLALTRGLLLWVTGDSAGSYTEVERAVEAFDRKHIENTVTVHLTLGLGTLRMHQGRYADALSHYKRASEIAKRLGNDTLLASVYGNLATCHGRLGNYQEQLSYSLAAPRTWGAEFGGLVEIQLAYGEVLSLVMLGRPDEALVAIDAQDQRLLGNFPIWMKQAWSLWKADLLLCAGRPQEASEVAEQTFRELGFALHSRGFAGSFARWLSRLHLTNRVDQVASETLNTLLLSLETYDALDQVEALCAARSLRAAEGASTAEYDLVLGERLRQLPSEIASHLRRLGSL